MNENYGVVALMTDKELILVCEDKEHLVYIKPSDRTFSYNFGDRESLENSTPFFDCTEEIQERVREYWREYYGDI